MNTPNPTTPHGHTDSPTDPDDPREAITYGVLMENGRLAPRNFASQAEAEKWAEPQEQVVSWNFVCGCDR